MDPALNNYLKAADMAYDIGEIHALTPDCAHYDTLLRQQEVLGLLDQAVDGGYVQAYPMKALLSASDDWSTFRLVRPELFRLWLPKTTTPRSLWTTWSAITTCS